MITKHASELPKPSHGRKLFFTLWPDDATRAALARLQPLVAGRAIDRAKLHLTLAFLGMQPEQAVAPLCAILDGLAVPPMTLAIDRLGYFGAPRIAWAGMTHVPDALTAMQAALVAQLAGAGFTAAAHGPFKPHVTLARDAAAPAPASFDTVIWRVAGAALVESVPATGAYRTLACQP